MGSAGGVRQANWRWWLPLWRQAGAMSAAAGIWLGALIYFSFYREVSWYGVSAILAGCGLIVLVAGRLWQGGGFRAGNACYCAGLALMFCGAGMGLSAWQVARAGGMMDWQRVQRPVWVVGRVAETEPARSNPEQVWVRLAPARVYMRGEVHDADEVRLTLPRKRLMALAEQSEDLADGDQRGLAAQALLWPPQGPSQPGARDGRLWRYLDPEHLRGYVQGELRLTHLPVALGVPTRRARFEDALGGLRAQIAAAANDAGDGTGQGVPGALLVGEWQEIPPHVVESYRRSGMLHLLAISGFQLTLVGGGLFLLLRWLMACWPALALRVDTKKPAAALAWLATGGYTLLAGAEVSVVRAFLMSGLLFAAVLAGRVRSLVRAWAVAVILIVLVMPSMVMRAGFQLSFVAVLALILWGESEQAQRPETPWWYGWQGKLRALVVTGVVAELATMPVLAADFGQVSAVGPLANLLGVPVMAVLTWIGMVALALWPLGGAGGPVQLPLEVLAYGVAGMNVWAGWLGGLRLALVVVPWWAGLALAPLCLTALILLYQQRWRLFTAAAASVVAVLAIGWSLESARQNGVVVRLDAEGQVVDTLQPAPRADIGGSGTPRIVRAADVPSREDCTESDGIVVAAGTVSACPNKTLALGSFAAAELVSGTNGPRWHLTPPACGRPWQQADALCMAAPLKQH